ncbi:cell wall-binding repeat-containing protein [Agrococcus jejuensis]|uniref:Putative cell wall binding repeat 2 n=1 Tax=Agrococcus jejuensis TaxID=399736 RepID=A0A1G8F2J1_9MICO|nr:cell wall-binding repeat-containing protein [Agrococcus jejuensis]SDH76373.1 Putative cell wall binding repeat 2 [Agrococcus jejuensis]
MHPPTESREICVRATWGVVGVGAIVLAGLTVPTVAAAEVVDGGVIVHGAAGVITMETAGTSETLITYDHAGGVGEHLMDLALSADGDRLAFQTLDFRDGDGDYRTVVVDVETGAIVLDQDADWTTGGYLVDISPDGTQLLMAGDAGAWTQSIATGAQTTLPGLGADGVRYPRGFAPDGDEIIAAVNGGHGISRSLDAVDVATGSVRVVVPAVGSEWVTPETISYDGTVQYSTVADCGAPQPSSIVDVDGSGVAPFAQPSTDHTGVFSPDGAEVLFVRDAQPRIHPCAGDASERVQQVLRGDRDGSNATAAFSAAHWDWAGTVVDAPQPQQPTRLAGADRFATSVALSQSAFPTGAPVVYLVSGTSFPDALSAGPAAAHEGGPVLLTTRESLPAVVGAEIDRLNPSRVVIVGGDPSISTAVAAQVGAIVGEENLERIAGANRYATSAMVATQVFGTSAVAYVASGEKFPDALAGGAAAGAADAPLLLVYGQVLDPDVAGAIATLGVDEARVIGSAASVSAATASAIDARVDVVQRLEGADRFATAVAVNQAFTTAPVAYVASGLTFPDALAGAAVAGAQGAPMYLTRPECLEPGVVADLARLGYPAVTILGGTPSVSPAVEAYAVCA